VVFLKEDMRMLKRLVIFSALVMGLTQIAAASDRNDDLARTQKAAQVFKEIMDTPDQGIPHGLLEKAKCIAIIPGDKKFAFIFGGNLDGAWPYVVPHTVGAPPCL
jgi:lipid-binding SYLF domain-containing protein